MTPDNPIRAKITRIHAASLALPARTIMITPVENMGDNINPAHSLLLGA